MILFTAFNVSLLSRNNGLPKACFIELATRCPTPVLLSLHHPPTRKYFFLKINYFKVLTFYNFAHLCKKENVITYFVRCCMLVEF